MGRIGLVPDAVHLRLDLLSTTFNVKEASVTMAENNAKDSRVGAVSELIEFPLPKTGNWTRRDRSAGRFKAMREAGGPFRGVQLEA